MGAERVRAGRRRQQYRPADASADPESYRCGGHSGRGNFSVALQRDGSVWTWGDNSKGQLGNSTYVQEYSPKFIPDMPQITAIAAGGNHVLAVVKDGTVVAWGDNTNGQLGYGTSSGTLSRRVYVNFLSDIKAVAAGINFSLALKNDGTVMAWGSNFYGQLGTGELGGQQQSRACTGIIRCQGHNRWEQPCACFEK
ncbi:hypothetical protein LJK88_19000 [Paenibacillus sp. P26]|nr:hypothetical protein LJK88_19000 [Paenibacillus sp. P26]